MHENAAAAVTLAIAVVVAIVGTICQVEAEAVPEAAARASHDVASPVAEWEVSLQKAVRQTERGFLQLAGLIPASEIPHEPPVARHPSHARAAGGPVHCAAPARTRGC